MNQFSEYNDFNENIGELILETLLSSRIDSITDLSLSSNRSWFWDPKNDEERFSNKEMLLEVISKLTGLQHLYLTNNFNDYDLI